MIDKHRYSLDTRKSAIMIKTAVMPPNSGAVIPEFDDERFR